MTRDSQSAWRQARSRPLVIGHRGASAHFPENTLEAFTGAIAVGADGVELDVHLCATGELVVFHDDDLKRLCGDPRRISEVPWVELSALRVRGCRIPRLDEVFATIPGALINVEIKRPPLSRVAAIARAVAEQVRPWAHSTLISSFDPRVLALLRLMAPSLSRALLFHHDQRRILRKGWLAAPLEVSALHPEHVLIEPEALARWHRRGYLVNAWTVDDPKRVRELAAMGVDALISNDPAATRLALRLAPDAT